MRILFIGGTRFTGPHAVRQLVTSGHDVAVFHRGQSQADLPAQVAHILGDRTHLAQFTERFQDFRPDVVVHMMAMTAQDAWDLTRVFAGITGRAVVISSQDVYRAYNRMRGVEPGPPDALPLAEDAPLRERLYPYRGETPRASGDPQRWMDDYDKILVERLAMGEPRLPATVLRLPAVYGPGDRQHRVRQYLKRMDDGRAALLLQADYAAWRWSRGYVENVAAAIAVAATDARTAGREYNVAEPEAPSEAEWAQRIAAAAGWHGRVLAVPRERLPESLRVDGDLSQSLVTDSTRLRAELGYHEPVPAEEALRRTVAWERANLPETTDPKEYDYAAEDAVLAQVG